MAPKLIDEIEFVHEETVTRARMKENLPQINADFTVKRVVVSTVNIGAHPTAVSIFSLVPCDFVAISSQIPTHRFKAAFDHLD
ncbi:MAG: hypothetical protein DMF72_05175 [Acidobacteria bacterium]|nr:MAG: hypothetical protein DMF72_05175 [Acidobacteriota bacterium]